MADTLAPDDGMRNLVARVDALERAVRFLEGRTHAAMLLPMPQRRMRSIIDDRRRDAPRWRCDCQHCNRERGAAFEGGKRDGAFVNRRVL